jgi:hypothetical protein
MPRRGGRGDGPGGVPDIGLTRVDRDTLLGALEASFDTDVRARNLLRTIEFPARAIPGFDHPLDFWLEIFDECDRGIIEAPYRRLINGALRRYGFNGAFTGLARRYSLVDLPAPEQPSVPAQRTPERRQRPASPPRGGDVPREHLSATCRVIVRIDSEEERIAVERWLAEVGLAPAQMWSTPTAVSYRLDQADQDAVRQVLLDRPDLGWTLVPPGEPDYLIRRLYVEGPDGRRFRVTDAPAQQTVGSLAAEVVEQYPEGLPGAGRPTVADHVGADGQGRRMNPGNTLYQEGIGEDDHVRVGFQATAAAVNPLDRQDALFGVRNQLQAYVDAHPDFLVWPNSSSLPTEYDIRFPQRGFGPRPEPGAEPVDIWEHDLSIVLGPEFPVTAPQVRWVSEVFHPNVFPTYDCEALRERDYMRGVVCLGTLAESYQPSLDFGELCATLRDIAGYRNYSLVVPTEEIDPRTPLPTLRGDFYDLAAALWAASKDGRRRIREIGGVPAVRPSPARERYGNVFERAE